MRYFDLRSSLPKLDSPAAEDLPVFETIAEVEGKTDSPSKPKLPGMPANEAVGEILGAGIGADRRSSPDLAGQLQLAMTKGVDTILCSLLDGDAVIRLNTAVAANEPEELVAGMNFLAELFGPKRAWFVADDTAPGNWLARLRERAKGSRRRMVFLRNDYPESDPSLIVYTLLGRKVRPGKLPAETGVLLLDGAAMSAIGRFVLTGRSYRQVPIAMHWPKWTSSRYFRVAAGTTLKKILELNGLHSDELIVRCGDLLRDQRIDADTRIEHGELTFHINYPEHDTNPDPCVRCGWCIEGCPVRVDPAGLLEAAERGDIRMGKRYGLSGCIECGICTYVCPSRLPILAGIRKLRGMES